MPFKSEKRGVLIPRDKDRRIKLTPEQRQEILDSDLSERKLALMYRVSRKLIHFVKFPEKYAASLESRKGSWKKYYKKDRHRAYIQDHRQYKHSLNLI